MSSTNNASDESNSAGNPSSSSGFPEISLAPNARIHYRGEDDDVDGDHRDAVAAVDASMNYCASRVTRVRARRDLGGTDSGLEGASWEPTTLLVENARARDADATPTLGREGFELVRPAAPELDDLDPNNFDDVVDRYYPLCERLLRERTRATVVRAFDHNVRVDGSAPDERRGTTVLQRPVGVVHNDYTHVSAPRRLEQLARPPKANDAMRNRLSLSSLLDPDLVERALRGEQRFAFVNVWRNVQSGGGPVRRSPLACVDAATMTEEELLTFEIVYADRTGENYFSRPTPRHQWSYFPEMLPTEALLLKQWDSRGTLALRKDTKGDNEHFLSTFSLHSAFEDPSSTSDAPPRESIEVRCVLIWDPENEQ